MSGWTSPPPSFSAWPCPSHIGFNHSTPCSMELQERIFSLMIS
jgi:hypothetical protein